MLVYHMLSLCHIASRQVLSILCGSDEILGSEAGRDVLGQCLADAFYDGMFVGKT